MSDMSRPGPPWLRPHGFLSDGERKHLQAKVRTCTICGLELLPGEKRAPSVRAHLDCLLRLEEVTGE
jgi:hypothetical protein